MKEIKNIDCKTLKEWLENDKAILIDVREFDEYKAANIPNAILFPLSSFNPLMIPQNPDKEIIFQCKSGKRSLNACQLSLNSTPHQTLWNLDAGIEGWIAKGYKTNNIS